MGEYNQIMGASNYKPSVEITLEQFKQFVLNNGIRRLWKLNIQ